MNVYGIVGIISALIIGTALCFKRGKARILGSTVSVVALSAAVFYGWKQDVHVTGFERISTGATQDDVRRLMGAPYEATDCSTTCYGYKRTASDPATPGCAEEFWYYSFYFPEAWQLTFNQNNQLIYKYHWVSP